MSISALTAESSRLLAYFQGAEASIESRVNAAVAAVPSQVKTYYVDAIDGVDTASGSNSAPLQTLNRALNLIYGKSGLSVNIRLAGDHIYQFGHDCVIHNSSVNISAATAGAKPRVDLVHVVRDYLGGANSTYGFSGENLSISFNDVMIKAGSVPVGSQSLQLYPHQGLMQLDYGGSVRITECDIVLGELPLIKLTGPVNAVEILASHISSTIPGGVLLSLYKSPVNIITSALTLDAPLSLSSIITGRLYSAAGYPLNYTSNYDFGA